MSRRDLIHPLPDSLDATIDELGALLLKGYVRYRRGREWIERVEGEAPDVPGERPARRAARRHYKDTRARRLGELT